MRALRLFEAVRMQKRIISEDVSGGPLRDDAPALHDDRAREQFTNHGQVVRGNQHGLREFVQQVHQLAATARIEAGSGLVEHEQLRLHRQHGGDGDALLLADAEMVRDAVHVVAHIHGSECITHARAHFLLGQALVNRAERDVVEHRGREELVVGLLKNQADGGAHLDEVGLRAVRHVDAADAHLAGSGFENAVQMKNQRAFAGAVRTEQGHLLAGRDRKRCPAQSDVAVRIAKVKVFDLYGVMHRVK